MKDVDVPLVKTSELGNGTVITKDNNKRTGKSPEKKLRPSMANPKHQGKSAGGLAPAKKAGLAIPVEDVRYTTTLSTTEVTLHAVNVGITKHVYPKPGDVVLPQNESAISQILFQKAKLPGSYNPKRSASMKVQTPATIRRKLVISKERKVKKKSRRRKKKKKKFRVIFKGGNLSGSSIANVSMIRPHRQLGEKKGKIRLLLKPPGPILVSSAGAGSSSTSRSSSTSTTSVTVTRKPITKVPPKAPKRKRTRKIKRKIKRDQIKPTKKGMIRKTKKTMKLVLVKLNKETGPQKKRRKTEKHEKGLSRFTKSSSIKITGKRIGRKSRKREKISLKSSSMKKSHLIVMTRPISTTAAPKHTNSTLDFSSLRKPKKKKKRIKIVLKDVYSNGGVLTNNRSTVLNVTLNDAAGRKEKEKKPKLKVKIIAPTLTGNHTNL